MMRPLLALLAALLCADGARADDDPFLPLPNTIDHVVTMQIVTRAPPPPGLGPGPARGGSGGGSGGDGGLRRIAHHGDWTRLDAHRDGRFVPVGHIGHAASVAVTMGAWDAPGRPARFLLLRRGPRSGADAGWERKPARTGERRIVNGEICEVWEVGRDAARGLARSGCVTDDGIEVSVRVVNRDGAEVFYAKAMSVERRSVRREDVQPPAGLLDLASWVGQARLSSPDPTGAAISPTTYETVMRAAFGEPGGGTRTRRRHGAWLHRETLDAAGRRRSLLVSNEAAGFHLFSDRRPDGAETLALWLQPRPQGAPWTEALGVAMGRHDRVLGQTCAYFDVARGMPGPGFIECRAQDGVVLKEENVSAPGRPNGVFEAVRVRRGGVALASVLPPGDLLAPARWGLR